MKIPFFGQSHPSRSPNVNAQRTINLFADVDDSGGKGPVVLYGTPGLTLRAYVGSSPVRGMYSLNDVLYVIAGTFFVSILPNGAITNLGTLLTTNGRVSIADNGQQIIIVDGTYGYIYTLSGGTFTRITSANFPGADTVAFIGGYFVINKPNSGSFQISKAYDGLTWAALDIATAESDPDNLVAVLNNHRELWLFGAQTTEVWYQSGRADFAFDPMNITIDTGVAARFSIAKADNGVFWVAQNKFGKGIVVRANSYSPEVISTRALEYQMATYPTILDAFGYTYISEGHTFYVLTFPSGNATWCYDILTRQWHERQSYGVGRHRVNAYAFFNNKHYVGDYANGNIYTMDMDTYTENGDPIVRVRRTQHNSSGLKNLLFHRLQIDMETGVGDSTYPSTSFDTALADGTYLADGTVTAGGALLPGQSVNPQAMLRWSDDGGHSWSSEHWANIGLQGEYGKRVIWRRLGKSRDRIWELAISDPVKVALIDGYIEATECAA